MGPTLFDWGEGGLKKAGPTNFFKAPTRLDWGEGGLSQIGTLKFTFSISGPTPSIGGRGGLKKQAPRKFDYQNVVPARADWGGGGFDADEHLALCSMVHVKTLTIEAANAAIILSLVTPLLSPRKQTML